MTDRTIAPSVQRGSERDAPVKIKVTDATKRFGSSTAVDGVSLDIEEGDFMVLLGPSGCGKSTLLRMIAGLQPLTSGSIHIEGRRADELEPRERDLAFVFQNYALYPHMSVRRNIAFPLLMQAFRWWNHLPGLGWWAKHRLVKQPQISQRVSEVAESLGLTDMLDRFPATLSGGQRQRVALGRAMVRDPIAFLMDEPLSNLDAQLRVQMRYELVRLHRELGQTVIYVTHDQVEAMTMGNRIGVMRDGVLQQVGTPREVYSNPANTFVAAFMGSPPTNIVPARLADTSTIEVAGNRLDLPTSRRDAVHRAAKDGQLLLGIRSEDVRVAPLGDGNLEAEVRLVEDLGAELLLSVVIAPGAGTPNGPPTTRAEQAGGLELSVRVPGDEPLGMGDRVGLSVDLHRASIFDPVTEEAVQG